MVHLKAFVLAVVCMQLLFLVEAYGKCLNDTEVCSKMDPENTCEINGVVHCCGSKDRVIKATFSDDEQTITACTCVAASSSNIGHRCTRRNVNAAPSGMQRGGYVTSVLTCAVVVVVVFAGGMFNLV